MEKIRVTLQAITFDEIFQIIRMLQFEKECVDHSKVIIPKSEGFTKQKKATEVWYQARNTRRGKDFGTCYAVLENGKRLLTWNVGEQKCLRFVGWFKATLLRRAIQLYPDQWEVREWIS